MTAPAFESQSDPGAEQPGSETNFERSFPTGEHCRLTLENARGRVRITGWDGSEVQVRATKLHDTSGAARFHATRIEAQQQGDRVTVRTVLDWDLLLGERGLWHELAAEGVQALKELLRNNATPAEVVYDVHVPRQADLDVKGISSEIVVEDVQGAVHVGSVSGPCTLARVQGNLALSTVSGALAGQELAGRLEAKSVSGSVKLAGRLDALELVSPVT